MTAWILVLVLVSGVPLGARGTFPSREACMAEAYTRLAALHESRWFDLLEFQCAQRVPPPAPAPDFPGDESGPWRRNV
jgi:hypothetical protein